MRLLDPQMVQELLGMLRALFDAQGALLERATVVASPIVANELILLEERRVESQRRDQAVGDAGTVNTQNRLTVPQHRIAQLGVADLRPLIVIDVPFST